MKNRVRLIIQFIFLGLIGYVALRPVLDKSYVSDFEKYCPMGGLASFFSKVNQDTMSCNMSEVQLMIGLGLILGAAVIGKLFCSFACPIGTFSEWIGRLGDKLKIRKNITGFFDRYLRLLKYLLLFVTIYITMTTSELFCKEFDPYYASVNLFDNVDITLYFAIPAFILVIIGSLFFRLFWCKYLCPLNAMSNIFMNVAAAGTVVLVYFLINLAGGGLSLVWLFSGLVLTGIVNELGFMKSFWLPFPKITRDADKCSNCGLCDVKCPEGINVSKLEVIEHIDCHLCSDCAFTCPLKNVVTVNKKKNLRYLAPVALVILIAISLGVSSTYELTTISMKWDKPHGSSAEYKQAGLKNIKCYGSSMALKGSLENIEGIYGLDTYAKSHTVRVYYDPTIISERKVRSSLFTPIKMEVRKLKNTSLDSLDMFEIGIYGFFDLIDFNNLYYAFSEKKGIYGFETHFGEPVTATVFYNPSEINPAQIRKQIETDEVLVKKPTGQEKVELNFKAENEGLVVGKIPINEYMRRIFRNYDRMFNGYKKYKPEELAIFKFPMPESGVASLRRYLGSLSSHLSADEGIVRLSTRFTDVPSGYIFYNPSMTNEEAIKSALIKDKLTIFVTETEKKDIDNPFHIKPFGLVYKSIEMDLDEEE